MTTHYRWDTTLDQRRRADPDIDDPARRAAARHLRLVADFDQATTTFINYTDALTA